MTVAAKTLPPNPPKQAFPAQKRSSGEEKALVSQRAEVHKRSYLNLRMLPDSVTAMLTVNGLEYGDEEFYRQAFHQLAQRSVENLILDVRRNHGGDARIMNNLLSYLADSSYVFLRKAVSRTPRPFASRFARYFDPGITGSFQVTYQPARRVGAWYEFDFRGDMNRLMEYQPTAPERFRGRLYVLMGGGTFSNAANFIAALKMARPKVTLIGRETGGAESGCGGNTNKLTLPNSGVVVQFH